MPGLPPIPTDSFRRDPSGPQPVLTPDHPEDPENSPLALQRRLPARVSTKIHPRLTPEEVAFKRELYSWRHELSMTQPEFARYLGLKAKSAHFSIGRWENLSRNTLPALKTIHLIKTKRIEYDQQQHEKKGVYVR